MKILWLLEKYFDTAPDKTTWLEMIKELSYLDHEVILLTSSFYKVKDDFGCVSKLVYVPITKIKLFTKLSSHFLYFIFLSFYLFKFRPNVVILDMPILSSIFIPFCILGKLKLLRTKFIVDIRTTPYEPEKLFGKLKMLLYESGIFINKHFHDGLTVITEALKKDILVRYKYSDDDIDVWTSGVSIELFNPETIKTFPEDAIQFNDRFVIIYHGSITPSRRLEKVIEAINILKNDIPEILFFILGTGPEKEKLEILIQRNNLEKYVWLHDMVPYDEVKGYVAKANLGILVYDDVLWWSRSSPLKLLEYLAMEKPVIVTDIQSHRDVIGDSKCGFFISNNKPDTIVNGILQAYNSRDLLRQYGKEGREIVVNDFTWTKQAKRLIKFVERIQTR